LIEHPSGGDAPVEIEELEHELRQSRLAHSYEVWQELVAWEEWQPEGEDLQLEL
jgi:hypothetical protein